MLVTVSATSWLTVKVGDEDALMNIRTFTDLIDLQRKFADVVATFTPPANACANRRGGRISPVTALNRANLAAHGNHLIMSMRGHIDVWSRIVGRKQFALRWRKKKIASLEIKLPVIRSWQHVTRKKDGSQRYRGRLPVYLVQKHNATVSLATAGPDIMLVGHNTVVSDASLRIVEAAIRRKAYDALQHVIDPIKLRDALPAKLRKLKTTIASTDFRALGGHAIAEINLAGHVPDGFSATLLQKMAAARASE